MTAISMFRDNLDNIPAHPLPDGYVMRPYQTGDIQHWLDFHIPLFEPGFITKDLFHDEYGHDEALFAQRIFFMQHGDVVMGSISSWFGDEERGADLGRVHWVVLHEDYRGKGLAKPLLAFALNKLNELGHTQAYLWTDTALIPAISLYLQFGLTPEISNNEDQQAWDGVFAELKKVNRCSQ